MDYPSSVRLHAAAPGPATIRCLVPDLPDAEAIAPRLQQIDRNRWYTNFGPLVREFEQRLAGFLELAGEATCVTVSSGTAALELTLAALGIGPGHRVLLPSLTFPATALAVQRCGAVPVFADVCPRRWVLTPELAVSALAATECHAVVPVAAFGAPLPAGAWDRFAAERGIPVVVDAAAALGSQRVGERAHWVFSLHATKPLGIGEGGLLATPDATLADRVRRLTNFGFEGGSVRSPGGTNAKLGEYGAAVGLAQLDRWSVLQRRRADLWAAYRDELHRLGGVGLQEGPEGFTPAVLCVALPADAQAAASRLAEAGIETRRWYLPPLHLHPAFAAFAPAACAPSARAPGGGDPLPVTAELARTLLGLPFHAFLEQDDVARVVRALAEALHP